ncbi:MAG: DUF5615 family PIN-like protein [Ardenticatenaceae bacterium]|nr:DUF5615 family PIN-like protein [Ardenticatenaceae bacterium]
MSDLCFLLDENLSPVIKRELLKVEPKMTILRVGDKGAPPLGTADEVILEWLQESGFILVTDNRKSMPEHLKNHYARGGHHHGILAVRRGSSLGRIIDELLLVWYASEATEYRDRIQFLPLV